MKSCLTTLCYIEKDESYLMLHRIKKEQDINKDKWVGIGGHFEAKESPEECLLREVKEETGLTLTSYQFRGIITFMTDFYETEYMCLYTADGFEGDMIECTEGDLEWVPKSKLGELNLWEGDYIFLRLLEERESFFSLKLCYEGDKLVQAVLDGEAVNMLFTQFNMEDALEVRYEEGFEDGIEQGIKQGIEQGELTNLIRLVCRKLKSGKSPEIIAEALEEELGVIEEICKIITDCGTDSDIEKIYEVFQRCRN